MCILNAVCINNTLYQLRYSVRHVDEIPLTENYQNVQSSLLLMEWTYKFVQLEKHVTDR